MRLQCGPRCEPLSGVSIPIPWTSITAIREVSMNSEELAEVVVALHQLCMAQAGRIAAMETVSDAVVATLGLSFPPLLGQLAKHIDGLVEHHRSSVQDESMDSYDAKLAEIQRNLRNLQR